LVKRQRKDGGTRRSGGSDDGTLVTTVGADAEDLQQVTVDSKVGVAGKVAHEIVDGAAGEGNHGATVGADEVVAMAGDADDIGGVAISLEEASQDIDRGEDFEGAVDSGAAEFGIGALQVGDDLLGGEGSRASQDGVDDGAARGGDPVAMIRKEAGDTGRGRT